MKVHQRILLILLTILMTLTAVPVITNAEEVYDLYECRAAAGELPIWRARIAAGPGTYTVTTSVLNVRSSASTDSAKLGKVYSGQTVVVTEVSGNWGKINYNGQNGWISLDYAQLNAPKSLTISDAGLALIKKYEGYRQYKYWDYNQYTIGYGTACGANDYPNGITEAEASALLVERLKTFETYLDNFLASYGITVTQNQYDALVSFTFNLGDPWNRYDSFKLKTILINGTANYGAQEVYDAFAEFVRAGGQVLPGLVTRRNEEATLFLKGSNVLPFRDVKSFHWHFKAVSAVYKKGIMNGVANDRFEPNATLTRAQMVTLLGQMSGMNKTPFVGKSSFSDVNKSMWYAPYVQWAYEKGIVSGTGNGKFSPSAPLTRQDMVVMLYNFTKVTGRNVSGASTELYKGFSDSANVSSYAVNAMNWAIHTKCISGDGGKLNPGSYALRCQIAQLANSFSVNILGK